MTFKCEQCNKKAEKRSALVCVRCAERNAAGPGSYNPHIVLVKAQDENKNQTNPDQQVE